MPIAGTQNYVQNGQGDGVIVIGLAAVAALLVAAGRTSYVWILGLMAGAVVAFSFFNITRTLGQMREDMRRELAGNPFAGLGEMAMQSVQMQWGWAVLVLGVVALVVAGRMAGNN